MASTCENKYNRALSYLLFFPAVMPLLWWCSPDNLHWRQTFYCTVSGWTVWFILCLCRLGGMDSILANVLTLEMIFGLVPVVYLFFDYSPYEMQENGRELAHRAQIFGSIPSIYMTKMLGRTVADMASDDAVNTCWHLPVDLAEVILFFLVGLCNSPGLGEIWFLIFTAVPAGLCSVLIDHMVGRMRSLLRTNARLICTAFDAIIHISPADGGKIQESSPSFDLLVGGAAEGATLQSLFVAEPSQLKQLCAATQDDGQIVRRLRTKLKGMDRSFEQDVELRVLAATEKQVKNEGISVGVGIMGERLPLPETSSAASSSGSSSLLLEQRIEDLLQMRVNGRSNLPSVTEGEEIATFDSIIYAECEWSNIRRRKGKRSSSSSSMSSTTSSIIVPKQVHSQEVESAGLKLLQSGASARQPTPPHKAPWKQPQDSYLIHCSEGLLTDLLESWNFSSVDCCHWHSAVKRLSEVVSAMSNWRACTDEWPKGTPDWQCGPCSALQFGRPSSDPCWLCGEVSGEEERVRNS